MKDNLQAPWIGYGPDYWDKDEPSYVDDCVVEDDDENNGD